MYTRIVCVSIYVCTSREREERDFSRSYTLSVRTRRRVVAAVIIFFRKRGGQCLERSHIILLCKT